MAVEVVPAASTEVRWDAGEPPKPSLAGAAFDRTIDGSWRRTSYSGLTARAHGAFATGGETGSHTGHAVISESDVATVTDESLETVGVSGVAANAEETEETDDARLRHVPLPLGGLAGGTQFGTYVHEVLEHTDFAAPDLQAALGQALAERLVAAPAKLRHDSDARETLARGLVQVIETPLGPLAGHRRLRDLRGGDRLDELSFELPLGGGWAAAGEARRSPDVGDVNGVGHVSVRAVAQILAPYARTDPFLASYLPRMDDPDFARGVRGYLTGSIDLVCRGLGSDAYLLVDYKTNRLGGWDDELSAWHYRPEALADGMRAGHYPLQALLYSVALHRYLRWRLPARGPRAYDPHAHLGGVLYLFVRGMVGPDTPTVEDTPCGVFGWRPSAEMIVALSDLLHTGRGTA